MSEQLCSRCSEIPFDKGLKTLRALKLPSDVRKWSLGIYGRIRASSCPFCEVVTTLCTNFAFASWEAVQPPDDSQEVVVEFQPSAGFVSSNFLLNSSICVASDSLLAEPNTCYARATFDEYIDFEDVGRWIQTCQKEHTQPDCCPSPFTSALLPRIGKRQLDFRVIDVQNMCITYAPLRCRYMALSYVLGTSKQSRLILERFNEDTLMQPGSLERTPSLIPNTIRDAITVVRRLQEQYLWVDFLCLVQDDPEEMEACTIIMNMVFEMAVLTIVAAGSEHAWDGLHGVEPTSRKFSRYIREIVPGLSMTTSKDVDSLVRRSTYATRAWTMQEEFLSSRQLIFVSGQIYYYCKNSLHCEELNWPGKPLHKSMLPCASHSALTLRDIGGTFADYMTMVETYLLRKRFHDNDVQKAFEGMLRKWTSLSGIHCFEGLAAPLEPSLIFITLASEDRARSPGRRRIGFPSYSWTGWNGAITYSKLLENNDGVSIDREVEPRPKASTHPLQASSKLRGWISWHCRLENGALCQINNTGRLKRSVDLRTLQLQDTRKNTRLNFQGFPAPDSDVEFRTVCPHELYPLLLFWTICIDLNLKEIPQGQMQHHRNGLRDYHTVDEYGRHHGIVHMDVMESGINEGKFALLATSHDTIFALMLVWTGEVAERWGIAELSMTAIDASSSRPRWKKVVLG